jgi:hypothetical protein
VANWTAIRGPWGTHVADVPLADAWAREARVRVAGFDALGSARWTDQKAALVAAWEAMGNAYRAANLPPPSDPAYRDVIARWYGRCYTDSEARNVFKVGSLQSSGGGEIGSRISAAWTSLKGRASCVDTIDVRVSLTSDGTVARRFLDFWDAGTCTGCADPTDVGGVWHEHPCDASNASTLQWVDYCIGLHASECDIAHANHPPAWSIDVLKDLLGAWDQGAMVRIDAMRSFVLLTNLGNAGKLGGSPEEYVQASRDVLAQADYISRGQTPARVAVTSAAAVAAVVCLKTGPAAPWCAIIAAAVGLIAQIWPVAVGVDTDALGVPKADTSVTAAWLPAMIRVPSDNRLLLDVPDAPGPAGAAPTRTVDIGPAIRSLPLPTSQTARGALSNRPPLRILDGPLAEPSADTSPSPIVLLAIAGLVFALTMKGKR